MRGLLRIRQDADVQRDKHLAGQGLKPPFGKQFQRRVDERVVLRGFIEFTGELVAGEFLMVFHLQPEGAEIDTPADRIAWCSLAEMLAESIQVCGFGLCMLLTGQLGDGNHPLGWTKRLIRVRMQFVIESAACLE